MPKGCRPHAYLQHKTASTPETHLPSIVALSLARVHELVKALVITGIQDRAWPLLLLVVYKLFVDLDTRASRCPWQTSSPSIEYIRYDRYNVSSPVPNGGHAVSTLQIASAQNG